MPRNGSGTYSPTAGQPVTTGSTIDSTVFNNLVNDVGTELTNSIARDGQSPPTANLPMGGFRHTGAGTATARTMLPLASQVQDEALTWGGTGGGTVDVITISTTPATTAHTTGAGFAFISSGANTGAVTLNPNSVGAKAVTKNGSTALAAGDIPSGAVVRVVYDGTRYQLLNIAQAANLLISNNTWTGTQAFNGTTNTFGGTVEMNAKAFNEADRVDVASAATTNLDTAASNYVRITGTTTITAITLSNGNRRHVLFAGALTLTNGASLILTGAANITTVAGDTMIVIGEASSVVRVVEYTRTSGSPLVDRAGSVVQVVNTQTAAVNTGTTTLPLDDTIPQNTEGDEYMTLAITPRSATNLLLIEAVVFGSHTANTSFGLALFQDATAGALAAISSRVDAGNTESVVLRHKMTSGTTSATTFKIRVGGNAAGTTTFNGVAGARIFGGVAASSITITEIKV